MEVVGLVVVYVVDLSVEGVDEDYLMNDLIRFDTYHLPHLDYRS